MLKTEQAKEAIEKAGGDWSVFLTWMRGQTVSIAGGVISYYSHDVVRFIEYKCNPDNEPVEDFD